MPKRLPRAAYPAAIEREYRKALLKAVSVLIKTLNENMNDVFSSLRLDDYDNAVAFGDDLNIVEWLKNAEIASTPYFEAAIAIAINAGQDVSRMTEKQLLKLIKSHYGVDVFINEPDLLDTLAKYEVDNINLIKSIPRNYLNELYGKVINALRQGSNKKSLITIVRETYKLPKNRAKLIARDQIGKINGNLTKIRQQNIGVRSYIWRTAKDERVRGNPTGSFPRARYSHYHREGKQYDWEKPPDDGNPGHPINCRCYAEPILPALQDLKGVNIYGI